MTNEAPIYSYISFINYIKMKRKHKKRHETMDMLDTEIEEHYKPEKPGGIARAWLLRA